MQMGNSAGNALMKDMPNLTANFNPTMADLSTMPGYQFNLQ
jgi:hypothetical protein